MQKYQATLIHPEVSGGRCSGLLELNFEGISFSSEGVVYKIRHNDLSLYAGGAGNRFVFFKDKKQEDISVYTADKSVLKNDFIVSNPNLSKEVGKAKKNLNKLLISSVVLMLLVFGFISGLYLAKGGIVKGLASKVPIEWENAAGDKLFQSISLEYKFIKNDSLKAEFLKAAAPLLEQIGKKGYKIDLYFVKDPTTNAFALPGGKVVIQTGLIANAKSWEEVMGVLSHELAHVTQRHHVRGIINNVGVFALLSATIGDMSALAGTFANIGGDLASLSNSRSFEHEADEVGWEYLVNAKISPKGLISFFESLKKETESAEKDAIDLSFLSTHPDTQNRIDNLKLKEKKLNQKFDSLPGNFEAFKTAISEIN